MRAIFSLLILFFSSLTSASNDEFFKYQWGLKNKGNDILHKVTDIDEIVISAKENEDIGLSDSTQSNKKIKVAVIDSGIDFNHPDLKDIIFRNESECRELEKFKACIERESIETCNPKFAKIDTNNNGYPLDCAGWNFAAPVDEFTKQNGNNDAQDLIGHGSFVSGVIAAKKNGYGIQGVSQNVKIIPVKVSGSEDEVNIDNSTDIFARGIEYAIKAKADIINLSVGWGFNQNSILVTQAIKKAISQNILVVVAAGNASHSSLSFPCAINEVICVGSHNPNGALSHFSNKGSSVDILAPGFKILSSWPLSLRSVNFTQRTGYEYKDGTSFSAPFVVGALARLLEKGFTPEQSKLKLFKGARKNSSKGLVLNGNLDIKKAIDSKINSFIYPLKKTPAVLNWNKENKKIKLIYKNYNAKAKNVKIHLKSLTPEINIKDSKLGFSVWEKDEIKEFQFHLIGPKVVNSELKLMIEIHSDSENKSYPVQVIASTIIHEKFKRKDAKLIKGNFKANISAHTIKAFQNISPFIETDYLVINETKNNIYWSLLKNKNNSYKLSKPQKTDLEKALIPHMARVDIDQDGKEDYVIFGYKQDSELNWLVKIFIYDHNFKKKNYSLNNNEVTSNVTTLNSTIKWTKINNEIVPTWISNGYIPKKDLPHLSPWETPTVNKYQQRIYYLSKNRLHYYPIKVDDEDIFPKTFLPQTKEEKKNFELNVLGFNKNIFFRDYLNFQLGSDNAPKHFKTSSFIDILESSSYLTKSFGPAIFNYYDPTKEETNISAFSNGALNIQNLIIPFKTNFDSIQAIIPNKQIDKGVFTLTKYNILFYLNGKKFFSENRNISNQVAYENIESNKLYLSSNLSPGLSSELIKFDSQTNSLIKPSRYRFLKFGSCIELEFDYNIWSNQYNANFYCDKNKKFIKINL